MTRDTLHNDGHDELVQAKWELQGVYSMTRFFSKIDLLKELAEPTKSTLSGRSSEHSGQNFGASELVSICFTTLFFQRSFTSITNPVQHFLTATTKALRDENANISEVSLLKCSFSTPSSTFSARKSLHVGSIIPSSGPNLLIFKSITESQN